MQVAVAAAQAALSDAGGTASTASMSRLGSQKLDRTSSEFSHPNSYDGSLQGSGPQGCAPILHLPARNAVFASETLQQRDTAA